MTLTDTQLVLLSAASRRQDSAIVLTPNLKGSAAGKVIGKLLRDGLVEEVPAGAKACSWRCQQMNRATRSLVKTLGGDDRNGPAP